MADSNTPTRKVRVSSTVAFGDVELEAGKVNTVDAPLARHLVASGQAVFADDERSANNQSGAVQVPQVTLPGEKKES